MALLLRRECSSGLDLEWMETATCSTESQLGDASHTSGCGGSNQLEKPKRPKLVPLSFPSLSLYENTKFCRHEGICKMRKGREEYRGDGDPQRLRGRGEGTCDLHFLHMRYRHSTCEDYRTYLGYNTWFTWFKFWYHIIILKARCSCGRTFEEEMISLGWIRRRKKYAVNTWCSFMQTNEELEHLLHCKNSNLPSRGEWQNKELHFPALFFVINWFCTIIWILH